MRLDEACFGIVEPAAFARIKRSQGLGIELGMINGRLHIDGALQLDADEAATARFVAQEVAAIAGCHERGHTFQFLHLSAMGTLQ